MKRFDDDIEFEDYAIPLTDKVVIILSVVALFGVCIAFGVTW